MEIVVYVLIIVIYFLFDKNSELKRENKILRLKQNSQAFENEDHDLNPVKSNKLPDNVIQFKPRKKDELDENVFFI